MPVWGGPRRPAFAMENQESSSAWARRLLAFQASGASMQRILSILRAAHCRSTHHYFAIDALQQLKTAQAQRLANILLKYHDDYLVGAKAPDSDFKDFQNHVIHVEQNNWGGAAIKCQEWLEQARQMLDEGKWKKAAYACGVLSHYFTDPIMPLHTGQSSRETVVHRPMEWSICKSYDDILAYYVNSGLQCDFALASDDKWIGKAVVAAASVAHRHYDRLIAIYDLKKGVANPRQGLNEEAVAILAELFALAIHGFSSVLSRLADETTAQLPQVSLTMTSLLATIDMPLAWIVRKVSDSKERRAVQAILAEYDKTGVLRRTLPAEIAMVEKAKIEQPELRFNFEGDNNAQTPELKVATKAQVDTDSESSTSTDAKESRKLASISIPSDDVVASKEVAPLDSSFDSHKESDLTSESTDIAAIETQNQTKKADEPVADDQPKFVPLSQARSKLRVHREDDQSKPPVSAEKKKPATANATPTAQTQPNSEEKASREAPLRIAPGTMLPTVDDSSNNVHYGSPLVEAPSIGPKTAKRFENIGIRTIRQFVSINAEELVERLATRWITVDLIRDWQDQARLVCEVPVLSGYRAQLLVAVGCRTSWQLRTSSTAALFAQLEPFCNTAEGEQILRSARVPTAEDVEAWIDSAKQFARRSVA